MGVITKFNLKLILWECFCLSCLTSSRKKEYFIDFYFFKNSILIRIIDLLVNFTQLMRKQPIRRHHYFIQHF